jgi:hypothetical protein
LEIYKDKDLTLEAWREILIVLVTKYQCINKYLWVYPTTTVSVVLPTRRKNVTCESGLRGQNQTEEIRSVQAKGTLVLAV